MERRLVFALLVFFLLNQLCFSKVEDENEDTSQVEISKRAIQTAQKTFRKIKSSFLQLSKGKSGKAGSRGRPGQRPGSSRKFRPSGGSMLDIVFVMDKSGSIGARNFLLEKNFMEKLTEFFPIFPAKTRVAIVSYSTSVKLEFNFNKYINKECLRKGIQNIRYTGGATATGTALQYVHNNLIFNAAAGARSDATKVIFVLTDGKSNRGIKPSIPAGQLRRKRVTIFAMGVTVNIREQELRSIASSPSHVFHVRNYAALNDVTGLLQGDLSRRCRNGRTIYDECGRRCTCLGGRLIHCCRLRKEFTDMTQAERIRYIQTVKTAATVLPYKTTYETLLTLHRDIFDTDIHERDFFLPWHRWFVLQYENLLQKIDCRVTVPYWDWSLVGANPFASDFWAAAPYGFGGNGNPPGGCVNTGPFRVGQFSLIPSAGGGCLTRNFDGQAPDAVAVATLLANPAANFFEFEMELRFTFHDDVHCIIDGTMCSEDSAAAPEFFLHHGFVDKIWSDWQKRSNAHKFNTFFQNHPSIMTSTPYRPKELLDLKHQPGCACAEYVDPSNSAYRAVKGLSTSQLQNIPRLPLPKISAKAARLFKTSRAQLALITRLRKKMEPKRPIQKSSLRGQDAKLGFILANVKKARGSG